MAKVTASALFDPNALNGAPTPRTAFEANEPETKQSMSGEVDSQVQAARVQAPVQRPQSSFVKARIRVGVFMNHLYTEITIMVLIVVYAIFVVVELGLDDTDRAAIESELFWFDFILLCLFVLELVAKLFAFGLNFLKNGWNIFDAAVIGITMLFALLETLLTSVAILRILRLRTVLRLFRLLVIFNRFKQTSEALKRLKARTTKSSKLESPVERALHILHELTTLTALSSEQQDSIEYVIAMVSSGRLYNPMAMNNGVTNPNNAAVDDETSNWLRAEYMQMTHTDDSLREFTIEEEELMDGAEDFDHASTGQGSTRDLTTSESAMELRKSLSKKELAMVKTNSFHRRVHRFARHNDFLSQLHSLDTTKRGQNTGFKVGRTLVDTGSAAITPLSEHSHDSDDGDDDSMALIPSATAPQKVLRKMRDLIKRCVRTAKLLDRIDDWTFDVFEAHSVSEGSPLFVVTANLLELHGCMVTFDLPYPEMHALLHKVEDGYTNAPYHNKIHAADVTQTTSWFISKPFLLPYVKPLELLGALLAAAVHDYRHPGVNNAFLVATQSELATRYNDKSVLEAMHVASFFALIKDDDINPLKVLDTAQFKQVRSLMIEMVLATDMANHFEEVGKFKSKLLQVARAKEQEHIVDADDSKLFLKLVLHTADVSNPAKPLIYAKRWANLILREFYAQGDKEAEAGLPISTFFDRRKPALGKLQGGFMDFIVAPLFEQWATVMPQVEKEVMLFLKVNRKFWARRQTQDEKVAAATPKARRRARRGSRTRRSSVVRRPGSDTVRTRRGSIQHRRASDTVPSPHPNAVRSRRSSSIGDTTPMSPARSRPPPSSTVTFSSPQDMV